MHFQRGATPSPRHRLAAAMPHAATSPTPSQWLWKPVTLSMWGNDVNGDCVTAEEAFAKGCLPGTFITDNVVLSWARKNGVLNGADLTQVMDLMRTGGFVESTGTLDDGPPQSVDWTSPAILQNAIAQGPVKIGIAADQLQPVVEAHPTSGWVATGFTKDRNEDHCVSLCGYGPASWLAGQLGASASGDAPMYALFTWNTIGLIDPASMVAITGEAWLRNPTTVIQSRKHK
jgi:hypothetical protein